MLTKELSVIIGDCIKIASNCEGKIFGGFVRDVIIPKTSNPNLKCEFKDVDIWFKTQIDADLFIKMVKDVYEFVIVPDLSIDDNNMHYTFNRTQYHLLINNKIVCWFDIVVSECFPVDDFDVNFLTYSYYDNIESIESQSESFDKDKLIQSIHKKKMIILPDYVKRLINRDNRNIHISRINKRFFEKGWSIKYHDTHFPKPLTSDWIEDTFGSKTYENSRLNYDESESFNCSKEINNYIPTYNSDNNRPSSENCIIS